MSTWHTHCARLGPDGPPLLHGYPLRAPAEHEQHASQSYPPQTKSTPSFCDCLTIAAASGLSITVLEFGKPYRGHYHKLEATRGFVGTLPKETLVLFADAMDVFFLVRPGPSE